LVDQCPDSEVRHTSPHARERTSGSKDTRQLYASSAAFEFEVPKRMCRNMIGTSNSPH
jgi:hypothetical protein